MFQWINNIVRSWSGPPVALDNPAAYEVFCGQPTLSGVPITKDTVFALPAFLHGVDLIASTIAGLDLYPYRTTKYSGKTIDEDHPAYQLLCVQPNPWQTPFEFRRQLLTEAIWNGNAYFYLDLDYSGRPTMLVPLDPEHTGPVVVRSLTDPANIQTHYITEIDGKEIRLDSSQVGHVKGLSNRPGGWVGMKLIEVAKDALGLALAQTKFASVYFKHSGVPSMVVELPIFIKGKEKIEEFRQGFEHHHEGYAKAHRLMILQGGAKLANNPNQNAEDMQLIEGRKVSITDIASILRLPTRMLNGENTSGTAYGNLEQENLSLIQYSFSPWMVNLEQQFERTCLSENERARQSREIRHDTSKLLEVGRDEQITNWLALVNGGLCLPNVANAALGLPMLDDDDNVLRVPTTVQPDQEEQEEPDDQETGENASDGTGDQEDQDSQQKLRSLTESVLRRFLVRLQKACEHAAKGDDWRTFPDRLQEEHGDILRDTLAPINPIVTEQLLQEWADELRAVTRDQAGTVFSRINTEALTRRILDGN
jgi:HK97 family phage portal protein